MTQPTRTGDVHYTPYAVFARRSPAADNIATAAEAVIARLTADGITVRGLYDVHAMPANADVLVLSLIHI